MQNFEKVTRFGAPSKQNKVGKKGATFTDLA